MTQNDVLNQFPGDFTTPLLVQRDQNEHHLDGISPTQPLNIKNNDSTQKLSSLPSSHSLTSQETSTSSYITAMSEIEKEDSNYGSSYRDRAVELPSQVMSSDDTIREQAYHSEDEGDYDTTLPMGLGIQRLTINGASNSASKSNPSITITADHYDDDPTPVVQQGAFQQHDSFMPTKPSILEDEDETPKLGDAPFPSRGHQNVSHNVTPVLEPQPTVPGLEDRYTNLRESRSMHHSPSPSGDFRTHSRSPSSEVHSVPVQEASAVQVSPVKTSPTKKSLKVPQSTHERPRSRYSNAGNDSSFNSEANDTTYSQESGYLKSVKQDRHNTADLLAPTYASEATSSSESFSAEEGELTSLFLYALHSFDSRSLEQSSDSSICLSFDKGDVAYVHTVDTSGWSEVTLIKSFKRGWVPINFFTDLVKEDNTLPLTKSRLPLKLVLISAAKFLSNPADNPKNGDSSFSIYHINAIRDGVRHLLECTDCLSRSTPIVKKKPIIRRMRKSLLADWYSLMIKADSYKHSKSLVHLETLQLMVLQVVKKCVVFLDIWGIESEMLKKEEEDKRAKERAAAKNDIAVLPQSPMAKERLNEIHNLLFTYIGLLLGRLDMVEHNPTGCQVLENVTHQMILLLREILFISKSCVQILNTRNRKVENKFDDNLDTLLSLVSELVSSVKNFVTKTITDDYSTDSVTVKDGLYYYTPEGDELIGVVSRMTRSISLSVENCYKYLATIGDFRLSDEKKYPDFKSIQITPPQFIKTCSVGMIKVLDKNKIQDLKLMKRSNIKRQSRFSMVRSGNLNDIALTSSGSNLLQEFLPDSKSFIRNSVFQPYLNESNDSFEIAYDAETDVTRDSEGRLIGASFRALVYILTDELHKPDEFFVSTFFLTFKLYSTGDEFIEEMIARFNLSNKFDAHDDYDENGEYSSFESRLKNRRRMVCRMFQLWLQSYWDYQNDYNLLPTLINFFNEGVTLFLPIEAKKLIQLCSKLTVVTPGKIQKSPTHQRVQPLFGTSTSGTFDNNGLQLVSRSFSGARHSTISHSSSIRSFASLNVNLDDEEHIFEEYELAKMNAGSRSSVLLPLPGLSFNNNSTLLSKAQIQDIEFYVMKYRNWLGTKNWPHDNHSQFYPVEIHTLLSKWFDTAQTLLPKCPVNESNLTELNAFELAKQLTIMESKIFLSIRAGELLSQNFQKRPKLAPNISQSLLFTNLLSEYVLDSILEPSISMKKRALRVKSWLNIALSCYYLKNFNSLAAIIISLQNHPLSRIDELWAALPEKYENLFRDLKKIIHPSNNYKGYRYKLSKILREGDTKSPIPVVPYVNLFLQDLTMIHEGNKDFRNSNSFLRSRMINFDKFMKIAKVASNVEYLQVGYGETMKKQRNSIFSFGSSSSLDDNITPILPLQEYILLELVRVHQLNMRDTDRYWDLSKQLKQ
ncbi:Bud site selection protein 5 [Cyberlindnera fabianii]|uniref:Bud site selection protein 5 n=1 Tax=Cyberlindnera fabianii TaxID=36022 RepID=A0A1V2L828_CYBFA|nr:Bud site selection protein 5 [Cyberlindnera fabianii]